MAKYIVNPLQLKIKESEKGSVYESIVVLGKRARQINEDINNEIRLKLSSLAPTEEDSPAFNPDRAEIIKSFERYPKPTFLAMKEMFDDKLKFHYPDIDNTSSIIDDILKK